MLFRSLTRICSRQAGGGRQQRAPLLTLDARLGRAAQGAALSAGDSAMKEFTYSEARQRLAALLERARREGGVRIRRKDGQVFVLRPEPTAGSPLDVPAIGARLSRDEILDAIREGRHPV